MLLFLIDNIFAVFGEHRTNILSGESCYMYMYMYSVHVHVARVSIQSKCQVTVTLSDLGWCDVKHIHVRFIVLHVQ